MSLLTLEALVASRDQSRNPATILRGSGAWEVENGQASASALVFGAAIPVDLTLGNVFTVTLTSNAAFQFSNPTGGVATRPQLVYIRIKNASGGAHGAGTFDTLYKVAGNVTAIANGNGRTYLFLWDGTNMVEVFRGAADIPN